MPFYTSLQFEERSERGMEGGRSLSPRRKTRGRHHQEDSRKAKKTPARARLPRASAVLLIALVYLGTHH